MPQTEKMEGGRFAKPSVGKAPTPGEAPSRPDDFSECDALDPALARLIELATRRVQAGETLDVEQLVAEHPSWEPEIRSLLPTMHGLVELVKAVDSDAAPPASDDDVVAQGRLFGDFRIVREIGRGGMGIVYEAWQDPPGRRVALKLLPISAAMDPRAIQRFQLEAQVAGLLQHPHIVPVYSVGIVSDVPYFAMQFIEGGSLADLVAELRSLIDRGPAVNPDEQTGSGLSALAAGLLNGQFAPPQLKSESGPTHSAPRPEADAIHSQRSSSIRSRSYIHTVARLGIQASKALGHAHDQGIVHRDIKPANLLLDRRGDLWVADFGMADVQGDAGLTMTGDLPGTLRYMSPEQALGKRAVVDRRTDIYSLGATLYELLSLQTAIRGTDRQEILRWIAEDEPEALRRLNTAVPIDLATIVTKALAKNPASRYDTAWRMADDLEKFLDGRPIAARSVGPVGRSWRWCRRKPIQAALAGSLLMTTTLGFAGITWNWRAAVHQQRETEFQKQLLTVAEKEARTQAAKADAINKFLIDKLLAQAEPGTNPDARKVTLLEVLDRAAAEVGKSFAGQPEVEAAIRIAIGESYHGLGLYARSEEHDRAAYELLKSKSRASNEDRLKAMIDLGHSLVHQDRFNEAEPLLTQALDESNRILGRDHEISLNTADYLGNLYQSQGRDDEAETLFRHLVTDRRRVRGPKHKDTLAAINNLGVLLEKRKKYAEAESLFRECLEIERQTLGLEHPDTLHAFFNVGFVLSDLGRIDEAKDYLQKSLDGRRRILGEEHPTTLNSVSKLAEVIGMQGHRDEAEAMLRQCLEAQRRIGGPDNVRTVKTAKRLEDLLKQAPKPAPNAAESSPASSPPRP